jgi:hypothetical protein
MLKDNIDTSKRVCVPVRIGPYQYVLVRSNGATSTIVVPRVALDAGTAEVIVRPGDLVIEVALKSTSDPDLDPARGQLWPNEDVP